MKKEALSKETLDIFFIVKRGFRNRHGVAALVRYWEQQSGLPFEPREYKGLATSLLRRAFEDLIMHRTQRAAGLYFRYVEGLDEYRSFKADGRFFSEEDIANGEEIYALMHAMKWVQIRQRSQKTGRLVGINGFTTKSIKETERRLKELESIKKQEVR